MNKLIQLLLIFTILFSVTGCTNTDTIEGGTNVGMDFKSDKILYNVALPYAEGVMSNFIGSYIPNRFDIDEIEYGLMQLSSNYFDPSKYSFREGQYLTKDILKQYLSPSDESEYGLNPATTETITIRNNQITPKYVSYILEQNYVVKEEDQFKTEGISLALVLNPYQYYRSETGSPIEQKIDDDDYKNLIAYGHEAANKLAANVREVKGLRFAKMVIGIYILAGSDSMVPGKFVEVGVTTTDELATINNVNMETYIIPSNSFTKKDENLARSFGVFKDEIYEEFGTYFSTIGYAKYYNNDLQKLTINLQINFESRTKLLGFTQIVANNLLKYIDGQFEIEVIVSTVNEVKATIMKEENQNMPQIHIYD